MKVFVVMKDWKLERESLQGVFSTEEAAVNEARDANLQGHLAPCEIVVYGIEVDTGRWTRKEIFRIATSSNPKLLP